MTTQQDYEAALIRFDRHLTQSEPEANGKRLTRHGGAYFTDGEITAIRHALKLAAKVMQEPSVSMKRSLAHKMMRAELSVNYTWSDYAADIVKEMRDQMLKEIEA